MQDLKDLLFGLLLGVADRRAPGVVAYLARGASAPLPAGAAAIPCLQALNIWFQLQHIAEENAQMRLRRQTEIVLGANGVAGSAAVAFARLAASKPDPAKVNVSIAELAIVPTMIAHPTEAKRVTVLEIHRRIYRKLVDLENQRWTARKCARIGMTGTAQYEIALPGRLQ